jgi:hypothetical protein
MVELLWLAASGYVPLLFFWSQGCLLPWPVADLDINSDLVPATSPTQRGQGHQDQADDADGADRRGEKWQQPNIQSLAVALRFD